MTPNFEKMTKTELRAYVISHPDDQNAFHAFVDRYTSDAPSDTYGMAKSPEDIKTIEQLIRQKTSDR
ncbi:DUF6887 family protein [Crocosphaera chwakensis]|uniref:Uncharacterized protein n=1 Tax=Crocosphaera chwakensis CCY0110 TaxID=391612 RepID=A3IT30_9CHRO|nr:hypothetical protein [Crocosphaera chwakensis]EAZ90334.1 hypothetical protein CY0110_04688 [Crocosphaera chwakensis CCY0110]